MLRLVLLCVCLQVLCEIVPRVGADNFIQDIGDYQYLYHDDKNFLLVLYKDGCYFIDVPDNQLWSHELVNSQVSSKLQDLFVGAIAGHANSVTPVLSSPGEISERYGISLDSYSCLANHIFSVGLELKPETTTTTTTTTTTKPTTTTTKPTTTKTTTTTTKPTTTKTTIKTTPPTTTTTTTTTTTQPTTHAHPQTTHHLGPHHHEEESTTHHTTVHTTHVTLLDTCIPPRHGALLMPVDVAFLIDTSTSVSDTEVEFAKNFIKNVIAHFKYGTDGLQVSVSEYDSQPHLGFLLKRYALKNEVDLAIDHMQRNHAPITNTGTALKFVRDNIFQQAAGDRPHVPNVLVIISDGPNTEHSQHTELVHEYELLHADHVKIITVGVGHHMGEHDTELSHLASDNLSFMHIGHYDELQSLVAHFAQVLCTEAHH